MKLAEFNSYLTAKGKSNNTILAYCNDVNIFAKAVALRGVTALEEVTETDIVSYVFELKLGGSTALTINRKLSSLRCYFDFLLARGEIAKNPTIGVKPPKMAYRKFDYLSPGQVKKVLDLPDDSIKGLRDRAVLELMYATGIRASELIKLKVADINLRMGMLSCHDKPRVIPFGKHAKAALDDYLKNSRKILLGEGESELLFLNYSGAPLSRQGLWKIFKDYAAKAELDVPFTPQSLRNSFAVHMLQNGADLPSVQKLMGHDDITATEIYLTATKSRIKEVYDNTHPRA